MPVFSPSPCVSFLASSLEGSGDSPTDQSGGSSTDRSFQERLAAILRKYKGDRQRQAWFDRCLSMRHSQVDACLCCSAAKQ